MKAILLLVVSVSIVPACAAQNINTANGYIPGQPYVTQNIDTINMASGGVTINIPLRSFKQQDGVSVDYSIQYGSKHLALGETDLTVNGRLAWLWSDDHVFIGSNPNPMNELLLADEIPFSGAGVVLNQDFRGDMAYDLDGGRAYSIIVDPDGAQHPIGWDAQDQIYRAQDQSGYLPGAPDIIEMPYSQAIPDNATFFTDRSGVVHTAWLENQVNSPTGVPVPLYQIKGFPPAMIQFSPTDHTPASIIDSKNLVLPWPDPNTGHVGTTIADTSHCGGMPNIDSVFEMEMPGPGGASEPYYLCYSQIHIQTNFPETQTQNGDIYEQASQDLQMLSAVTLPNNTSWTFTYDDRDAGDDPSINYGTLTKITFPTGGSISYIYTTVGPCRLIEGDLTPESRFISKRIEDSGNGDPATWTYTFTPGYDPSYNSGAVDGIMTVQDPDGAIEAHMVRADNSTCGGYDDSYTIRDSSNNLLSEVDYYQQLTSEPLQLSSTTPYYTVGDSIYEPDLIKTTLEDGSWYYHALNRDIESPGPGEVLTYDNVVEECTYDFGVAYGIDNNPGSFWLSWCGPSGSSGPISHTITSYEYQSNSNVRNENLMTLPHQVTKYDAMDNVVSQTKSIYDSNGADGSGFYGNLSEVDRWLSTNSSFPWVPTIFKQDSYGVMTSSTDALGHITGYGMDPNDVYVQTVTKPSTNGVAHTTTSIYDPNIDVKSIEYDENGKNSPGFETIYGYDPMLRVNSAVLPTTAQGAGGANLVYVDSPNASVITANMQRTGSSVVTASESYDGFGRPWRFTVTDPAGNIYTDTTYDGMGRVVSVSNPYRSTTDSNYGMTCTDYDLLNRVTAVRHVAGGSCSLSVTPISETSYYYSGPFTDIYDGDGHHSRQQKNSLGQLIKVWEPDSSNNPTLETDYSYDALGNLASVNQIGVAASEAPRSRNFTYDSLSRLISAYNPETGVGSGSCPGVTGPWSICYGYDLAGNLTSKIDARGIETTMHYDALDRLTSKTYSLASGAPDPNNTPSTCYSYDLSQYGSNFKGRLSVEWTQFGTCASAPPANALSSRRILSYDALGHITEDKRCTLGNCFDSGVLVYDLAGNLTQYFNQAMQINNQFDNVDRLQQVTVAPTSSAQPISLYSVTSFGPVGPVTIDLGAAMTKVRSYDAMDRPTGEATIKP